MATRVPCRECGAEILPATAAETGGLCMPCQRGTRQAVEAGQRARAAERDDDPFSVYWRRLIARIYDQGEKLRGSEELFYRWSCLMGETMVDGLEAYFERRWEEYEADMQALGVAGFPELAADFREAKALLFGPEPLSSDHVENIVSWLLEESPPTQPILATLDVIYARVIPRLEKLAAYRYEFGLREGLYRVADGL